VTRSQKIVAGGVGFTIALLLLLWLGFFALNHGLITPEDKKPDLVFNTKGDQDRAIHDFFAGFAAREGYSFADSTPETPPEDGNRGFALEMDRGGQTIKVLSGTQPNRFFVFAKNSDPVLEARLLAQLRRSWPDAAEYKGP
jgi:hypothetical protein